MWYQEQEIGKNLCSFYRHNLVNILFICTVFLALGAVHVVEILVVIHTALFPALAWTFSLRYEPHID